MLGTRRHLYSNSGTGKIHVGSYTMRTGVQEQTLKQSTYQIPRSFTTCACAIFMGQRNNNKNEPCGSWVISQWLTEQKGQEGETSEWKSGGSKGWWNGVQEGCGAEHVGLCRSGLELAGNDAGIGVRSGGHADVIG